MKNEDNILHLKNIKGKTFPIIDNDAVESPYIRDSDCSCKSDINKIFKVHISLGYGSGTTYFNYIVNPYNAIKSRAEKEGFTILSSNNIIKTEDTIECHKIEVGKENILLIIKYIIYIKVWLLPFLYYYLFINQRRFYYEK